MLRKLAGAAALSIFLALAAPVEGDMALGATEGAKVTVVEYATGALTFMINGETVRDPSLDSLSQRIDSLLVTK